MNKSKRNIKTIISWVMLATVIGKVLGFVKELVLAYFFGAGVVSDAYLISQTIPGTLFQVIGVGISTCFIPIYIKIREKEDKEKSDYFINQFITMIICISLVMTIILEIIPWIFVKLFAVGFNDEAFEIAVKFTRINAISLVFSGLLYCYSALLQSENKYHYVSIAVIPYNICLILSIVLGYYTNMYIISIGSVIAVLVQLVYEMIWIKKIPYNYKPIFKFYDEKIKMSLLLLPPVILGVAAAEINTIIDRTLASSIIVGGITIITYGTSLFNLVIGIFSQSISAVYYPIISQAVTKNDKNKLVKTVQDAIYLALYFLIPITVGTFIMKNSIVRVLFGHGNFGTNDISILSKTFACYSIGFIPFAIKSIISNVYYSYEKTKKPMINTIISVVFNIILNIILSKLVGLIGLAIATGISAWIVAILLIKDCKKDFNINGIFNYKKIIKLCLATIIMGSLCYIIRQVINPIGILSTILVISVSAIFYIVITMLLKICPYSLKFISGGKNNE